LPNKTWLQRLSTKGTIISLTISLSFILPIFFLYLLVPETFQLTWKGRFSYLLFLWLFILELVLAWDKISTKTTNTSKLKLVVIIATVAAIATIATAYVTAEHLSGLKDQIVELGKLVNVPYQKYRSEWLLTYSWPLSLEALFLAALFTASILLTYGIKGLKWFSVSLFFIGAHGSFLMIDTFYPRGTLAALQNLVPPIASSVTFVLNGLGYRAQWFHYTWYTLSNNELTMDVTTILRVSGGQHAIPPIAIYWPCSGAHSLFIYTFVILLFIKSAVSPLHQRTVLYAFPSRLRAVTESKRVSFLLNHKFIRPFVEATGSFYINTFRLMPAFIIFSVGALGTFFVNILRIVSITVIGLNTGADALLMFHDYYGEFFFITWMFLYLALIVYGPSLWGKLSRLGKNENKSTPKTN